jgi:hypothetical protein
MPRRMNLFHRQLVDKAAERALALDPGTRTQSPRGTSIP